MTRKENLRRDLNVLRRTLFNLDDSIFRESLNPHHPLFNQDEEIILKLLEDNGGYLFQSDINNIMGYSDQYIGKVLKKLKKVGKIDIKKSAINQLNNIIILKR